MKTISLLLITSGLLLGKPLTAQDSLAAVSRPDPVKKWVVASGHAVAWTGTFLALNQAWYADYPRAPFHFFNDNAEWNQLDKAGHVWTTNRLARASAATWTWAGFSRRRSAWYGAASAVAFQSIIEIQDGFSAEWGFSWGDMAANFAGAGAFLAQELGWQEQRIQVKFGYWPHQYPPELTGRRNDLFGKGFNERILKDYNSQTYWVSGNMNALFGWKKWPRWLMLSVGYGSDMMLGGRENRWTSDDGITHDYRHIPRTRRFYLSADLDLTQIPTRSKALKTVFFLFNAIKIPAPALQWNNTDGFRGHWLHE